MHTTEEWHGHAHFNMSNAFHTQKKADNQLDMSMKSHHNTHTANLSKFDALHATMEQKVKMTWRIKEKLHQRADSLQHSNQLTRQSLAQLDEALHNKEEPLRLCMWRIEERKRRPQRELVHDNVTDVLEDEKNILLDTRRRLTEAIQRTKSTIVALDDKLGEVLHDLDVKDQALELDDSCVRQTHKAYHNSIGGNTRSSSLGGSTRMPAAGKRIFHRQLHQHESGRNEVNRQQDAVQLDQSAANREEIAKSHREDNKNLIALCQKMAEEAAQKSENAMQERINEIGNTRKRLETELCETNDKMNQTKDLIGQTRQQMKNLEEPMENAWTCNQRRQMRTPRENILDPVSKQLQEHQATLVQAHDELSNHHNGEKRLLQDLHHRREHLKDDLNDKMAALRIEMNCLAKETTLPPKLGQTFPKSRLYKWRNDVTTPTAYRGGASCMMPMTAR